MDGSHVAGAGIGAIVGATLVALGNKIGLNLTNLDSATLGMAAIGAFVGLAHGIGKYGLAGLGGILLHGSPKPPPAVVVPVVAGLDPAPPVVVPPVV